MSSNKTPLKLPIIDFSVERLTLEWALVREQVRQAAEEFGCFEARFDKITSESREMVFDVSRELLDLPLTTKQKNVSEKPFHGYIGQSDFAPLYESVGFDEANVLEKVETLTAIFWPQGNPKLCKTIQTFSKQLLELDEIVRRMILESLGVDKKKIEDHISSVNCLFRVMKYNEPQTAEAKPGLNTHTDLNFLTILYQHQAEGLELQTKQGQWISVKLSDSFIVMIGDSLKAYSNGRLHSPFHRVMMAGKEARYSTGLFIVPKEGCIIRAPQELVDEKHPLLFNPFDYFEFLQFYTTEAGKKAQSVLDAFCGVR